MSDPKENARYEHTVDEICLVLMMGKNENVAIALATLDRADSDTRDEDPEKDKDSVLKSYQESFKKTAEKVKEGGEKLEYILLPALTSALLAAHPECENHREKLGLDTDQKLRVFVKEGLETSQELLRMHVEGLSSLETSFSEMSRLAMFGMAFETAHRGIDKPQKQSPARAEVR